MNNQAQLQKLFGRMVLYGVILGALSGGLVLWTIEITIGHYAEQLNLFWFFFSFIFGVIGGSFVGGISGCLAGFVMTLVTSVAFSSVRSDRLYKVTMGAITFVAVSIVFGVSEIWYFLASMRFTDAGKTWTIALAMSVVIAVYASQITARKYINEISVQKEKAKV